MTQEDDVAALPPANKTLIGSVTCGDVQPGYFHSSLFVLTHLCDLAVSLFYISLLVHSLILISAHFCRLSVTFLLLLGV